VEDGAQITVLETNRLLVEAGSRCWRNSPAERCAARRLLERFAAAASTLESLGWSAERIREHLEPSRQVFATSSFMRRCQQWPRGYPGDFETIEYLTAGINQSTRGTLGWHLEQILLESPVVRQHHNKMVRQSLEIERTVKANSAARVFSIACGGGLDWAPVLVYLKNFDGEIVLNDCEPAALELAERRLRSATPRYRLVPGNILRVVKRLIDGARFDLVVAGGLFDYLSDKSVVFLLRAVARDLLASGGTFLFTNIARGNPYRVLMEYGANWTLIERSEEQVLGALHSKRFDALLRFGGARFHWTGAYHKSGRGCRPAVGGSRLRKKLSGLRFRWQFFACRFERTCESGQACIEANEQCDKEGRGGTATGKDHLVVAHHNEI
jgi:ubiquinone/menaquinone biosynthesis C-methylase UbiE